MSLVPLLRELLADESARTSAAWALWRLTGDSADFAEPLARDVATAATCWPRAVDLLTTLGPAAQPVLSTLRDTADSDRCPLVDPGIDRPADRGIGHRDDQFLAAVRDAIAAIDTAQRWA